MYSMTACGALLVWEPDGETFRSRVAVPEHDEGEEYVVFRKYLAESLDGDLVLVWREHRSSNGGDGDSDDSSTSDDDDGDYAEPDPTVGFQVFVLREGRQGRREWKELRDLGGAALFIGYNSAVFFPAGEVPGLLPDCIYFSDDTVGIISCRNKQEPRDMGVFTFQHEEQSRNADAISGPALKPLAPAHLGHAIYRYCEGVDKSHKFQMYTVYFRNCFFTHVQKQVILPYLENIYACKNQLVPNMDNK